MAKDEEPTEKERQSVEAAFEELIGWLESQGVEARAAERAAEVGIREGLMTASGDMSDARRRAMQVVEGGFDPLTGENTNLEDRELWDGAILEAQKKANEDNMFMAATETLQDEDATDQERREAAEVVQDRASEEEGGGFIGDLKAYEEARTLDDGETGDTDLLQAMRALYGFEPDEGDIIDLTQAIMDSGEYRIPTNKRELEIVLSQEITRFAEGDPEQSDFIKRAFADVGSGMRRISGQVRVGNRWIDYDPEVDAWLYGRESEGNQAGVAGFRFMDAKLAGDYGDEMGHPVGGWISELGEYGTLIEDDFRALAVEEDIDMPYAAAIIELNEGWGQNLLTDEEQKLLRQNTREWRTNLGEGASMVTRIPSSTAQKKGKEATVTLGGARWNTAVTKWNEAVEVGRNVKPDKNKLGNALGRSVAVSRQKDEAARELKSVAGQSAIASFNSFKATMNALKKKASILNTWKGWFRQGKAFEQQYGDQQGGLLAFRSRGLAEKYSSGARMSGEELYQVDEINSLARYSAAAAASRSKNRIRARQAYRRYVDAWSNYYDPPGGGGGGRRGGGGGGGGTVVKAVAKLPSEEDVKNSVQTLFRSWFRREPTDGEVKGIKKKLDGVIIHEANQQAQAQAFGGSYTETDKEALILDHIRKSPEYQKLFAGKAGGQTEEEYANMFEQGATELFGNEMGQNDEAIRAGMMESREQTTLGYLAGTKAANDSSNFQERLSKAAQIVAELT